MSGRHKFSELTKNFTPADWQQVAALRAEMRAAMEPAQPREQPQNPDTPADGAAKRQ